MCIRDRDEEQFVGGSSQTDALNWYYFGARYYDSEIGRWLAVDPLAAKAPAWTPYRFGLNKCII